MNIHRILAVALIAVSLTLVGCGGGGGGGSSNSGNNTSNTDNQGGQNGNNEQASTGDDNTGGDSQANHGNPDAEQNPPGDNEEQVAENDGDPIDPELLLPVDNGPGGNDNPIVDAGNGNNPDYGYLAANPEPTTAALAAMGLAFLATRRYGRTAR